MNSGVNDVADMAETWGKYAPRGFNKFLVAMRGAGVAHGPVRKWMRRWWIGRVLEPAVDIVYRDVKFRLYPWDNNVESKILFSSRKRDYRELEAIREKIGGGGVFVDIGANIGYYALTAAAAGAKRVVAVEPNPVVFSRLTFNIAANGFGTCVSALPVAVGDREGTATLHIPERKLGGSSIIEASTIGGSVNVTMKPLAKLLSEQGIEHVDAMKIDVEGKEDAILFPFFERAPVSLWPTLIVMEHSHGAEWGRDILRWLHEHGYVEKGRTRSNAMLQLGDRERMRA